MSKVMNVPEGWEVKQLKDVGEYKNGLTYSPADVTDEYGILVLRSSNIQDSKLKFEDNVFVRNDIKLNYRVQEGDILVCVRNGSKRLIGKNALITKEVEGMAHGAFMTIFHSKNYQYIFQLFQSDMFFQRIEKNLGATINSINNRDLILFEFPFPEDKLEQQKIAKILSTLDRTIEATQKLIAKEKNIKKGLMHDLLSNGIDENGKIRSPETHKYKESELGLIPEEWEVHNLGRLSSKMTNGFVGTATPFYVENNGVLYLYGNNVRPNKLDMRKTLYVSYDFHIKQKKSQLLADDMLTVQSGHIGTSAIVPNDMGDLNCHALIITRFKRELAVPQFISYYINSDLGMNQMAQFFVGSTILHINVADLKRYLVSLPDIVEQKQIVKLLTTQDTKIETEEKNLAKLKELKKGLMDDLLSGKVRVKV